MKLCGTCKFWEPQDWHCSPYQLGRCEKAVMFWEATEWDSDYNARTLKDEYKDAKSFAQDGSDYSASLITMPDFGCVSHCEKDEK